MSKLVFKVLMVSARGFVGEMTFKNNDINFCLTVEFCRVKTEIESKYPIKIPNSNLLKCRFELEKAQLCQIISEID